MSHLAFSGSARFLRRHDHMNPDNSGGYTPRARKRFRAPLLLVCSIALSSALSQGAIAIDPVFQFSERHEFTQMPTVEGQVATSGQFYSNSQDAVDVAYETLKEMGFEKDVESSAILLPYVNGVHNREPFRASIIFHPERIDVEIMANSTHVEGATRDLMLTFCRVLIARFMQRWDDSLQETQRFSLEQRNIARAAKQEYLDNFRSKVDWQAAIALFGTAWMVSHALSPSEESSGRSPGYSNSYSPPPVSSNSAEECLRILREDVLSNRMRYIQFKCPRSGDWTIGAGRFLYQKESGKWGTTKGALGRVYSSPTDGLRKECGCD